MEIEIGYTELTSATINLLKDTFELFSCIDDEDARHGAEFGFAENGGEIVAACQYVGNRIHLIQSKPGTGAGAALMDALKEHFGSDGIVADNALKGAIPWYESQGFEKGQRTFEGWDMIWYPDEA